MSIRVAIEARSGRELPEAKATAEFVSTSTELLLYRTTAVVAVDLVQRQYSYGSTHCSGIRVHTSYIATFVPNHVRSFIMEPGPLTRYRVQPARV